MKFTNGKKVALATLATTMMSTVVNAATTSYWNTPNSVGGWVSLVAEILSVLCLVVFVLYTARYFSVKGDSHSECDTKVSTGVKNGMITALVGIAICQAGIIVAQLCF